MKPDRLPIHQINNAINSYLLASTLLKSIAKIWEGEGSVCCLQKDYWTKHAGHLPAVPGDATGEWGAGPVSTLSGSSGHPLLQAGRPGRPLLRAELREVGSWILILFFKIRTK